MIKLLKRLFGYPDADENGIVLRGGVFDWAYIQACAEIAFEEHKLAEKLKKEAAND